MSKWISPPKMAAIFEVQNRKTAIKIAERAGVKTRQLPGLSRQYDLDDVQRVAAAAIEESGRAVSA